jgi:hypothetical protein
MPDEGDAPGGRRKIFGRMGVMLTKDVTNVPTGLSGSLLTKRPHKQGEELPQD